MCVNLCGETVRYRDNEWTATKDTFSGTKMQNAKMKAPLTVAFQYSTLTKTNERNKDMEN